MKYLYVVLFFVFSTIGVSAQSYAEELNQTAKELTVKISDELNIDSDKQIYLQRAIYSTKLSQRRANEQFSNNPDMLETSTVKIKEAFDKMLELKFDANQISAIKDLISADAE
jgi:hypothetical protein